MPIPREAVGTLHSHAYRAIGAPQVAEAHAKQWNEEHPGLAVSPDARSMSADDPLATPKDTKRGDELLGRLQLYRARMTPRELWRKRVRDFADEWEAWKADCGMVDFADMIERALQDVSLAPGSPRVVLADEAQDYSRLELALLRKWGAAADALIVTGDPDQALYEWRGAAPEVFVDPAVPDNRRQVLAQSYRVPRAVHAASMALRSCLSNPVPIDYRPRDADGSVATGPGCWCRPERTVDVALEAVAAGQRVQVMASCGFMLGPLLAILRRRGVPFSNPWRMKRGDWNPLRQGSGSTAAQVLAFLRPILGSRPESGGADFDFGFNTPNGDSARCWTAQDFDAWVEMVRAAGTLRRGAKKEVAAAAKAHQGAISWAPVDGPTIDGWCEPETAAFLGRMLTGGVGVRDALAWLTGRLLSERRRPAEYAAGVVAERGTEGLTRAPRLHVGTIHSFKGSQSGRVFVFPDLSAAGWEEWRGAGRDAIVRMFYVAVTRAKEDVVLCQPSGATTADLARMCGVA